ncbi:hypothetical protein CFR71_10325 [Novacetimonas pomaceti]|uniref:Uncharacterized protein n=1 Tax=Novacetimonas pomaceti TaxID=2021998 RepID=A0A318QR84_9PROT|nr:hypothetical protein CFR71_10325 [Novacetimonas pomaceti]
MGEHVAHEVRQHRDLNAPGWGMFMRRCIAIDERWPEKMVMQHATALRVVRTLANGRGVCGRFPDYPTVAVPTFFWPGKISWNYRKMRTGATALP